MYGGETRKNQVGKRWANIEGALGAARRPFLASQGGGEKEWNLWFGEP